MGQTRPAKDKVDFGFHFAEIVVLDRLRVNLISNNFATGFGYARPPEGTVFSLAGHAGKGQSGLVVRRRGFAMEKDKPAPPIWFPQWAERLPQLRLPALRQQQYRFALIQYLRFCKQTGQKATVNSARAFMQEVTDHRRLAVSQLATWREALNWFFREGGKQPIQPAPVRAAQPRRFIPKPDTLADVPSLGAADTGTEEWERRVIQHLRTGHYRWRTEQAYRHWAGRFVRWLEKGHRAQAPTGTLDLHAVTEADVKGFLSEMATLHRTSASSQKQALNAIVFLLREVYQHDVGDFSDFTRAAHNPRIPVVLSREECRQLFAALDGTTRLMAELMYGSGLRLMELLRLRIPPLSP
ncbi:MAG: Tyrosine recombinase XerC [Verrucomicrobiae bacterium]|nr:Tyrosine recombinase XerC [Verrucomicrobiae bacterium]